MKLLMLFWGQGNGVHTSALRPPWLVGIGGATATA